MRGKDYIVQCEDTSCRITPAHAGKSKKRQQNKNRNKDHPRPCGEKRRAYEALRAAGGSPPPMRGKACPPTSCQKDSRITPAHAGKSIHRRMTLADGQDHPRPCGEKCYLPAFRFCALGSPPPMRGKVLRIRFTGAYGRITPAHAGKSCSRAPNKTSK